MPKTVISNDRGLVQKAGKDSIVTAKQSSEFGIRTFSRTLPLKGVFVPGTDVDHGLIYRICQFNADAIILRIALFYSSQIGSGANGGGSALTVRLALSESNAAKANGAAIAGTHAELSSAIALHSAGLGVLYIDQSAGGRDPGANVELCIMNEGTSNDYVEAAKLLKGELTIVVEYASQAEATDLVGSQKF